MSAMNYPDEWPGFEVTIDCGRYVPLGGIVEGVEIDQNGLGDPAPGWIGARILDEEKTWAMPRRCPVQGYAGIMCHVNDIRPLTPAARAMLAIARGK